MNPIRNLVNCGVSRFLKISTTAAVTRQRTGFTHLRLSYSTTPAGGSPNAEIPVGDEAPISVSTPLGEEKNYDAKIVKLVDEISKLTLLEVADLNELLKKTLNIPDTAMMMGGMSMMGGGAQLQQQEQEVEEVVPVKVQTQFTVKLLKFDEAKKVPLIKEIKALLEGMNLVQAKKFVESAPTTVKADISKEDADTLVAALTAVGATCEVV